MHFETELLRDLVVHRKSLWAQLLLKSASRIISPRFYVDTHYFGGSTTFFLGNLANGEAVWRSGLQQTARRRSHQKEGAPDPRLGLTTPS